MQYDCNHANHKVQEASRQKCFDATIKFLKKINSYHKMPPFITLKQGIGADNLLSLRTFQSIMKEKLFACPSWWQKTKQVINKKIKRLKEWPRHPKIIKAMATIKLQWKYVRKFFPLGNPGAIDACEHPWFGDEKVHLYCAVNAKAGLVLVEHVAKEETPMGYIICLKKLLLKHGKPRLMVIDKRTSYWNGPKSKSQINSPNVLWCW